jgi:hypothetical protein
MSKAQLCNFALGCLECFGLHLKFNSLNTILLFPVTILGKTKHQVPGCNKFLN